MINAKIVLWLLGLSKVRYSSAIVKIVSFMLPASSSDAVTLRSKLKNSMSHGVYSSSIFLYAANDPIIEASSGLRFGPFNLGYPKLAEQARNAELDPAVNKWELVFDFSQGNESNFSVI